MNSLARTRWMSGVFRLTLSGAARCMNGPGSEPLQARAPQSASISMTVRWSSSRTNSSWTPRGSQPTPAGMSEDCTVRRLAAWGDLSSAISET